MSYLKKNERYQPGCTGSLYFNPAIIQKTQLSFDSYSSSEARIIMTSTLGSIVGDIIAFGGQVVGYVDHYDAGNYVIHFPEETWPDMSSELENILTDFLNNYDYIYSFRPNYDYAYEFSGAQHGTGFSKHPDTCIENVLVKSYTETTKRKTFGFHRQQFDVITDNNATLEIPPNVDKIKIDQMLNSDAVIFVPDNRVVKVKSMAPGWKFDKPKGGGSINPIGRKISIKTDSMKYGLRRGYQLLDAILEG